MSGFSPEWLALREPADTAARSPEVLVALQQAFADRTSCRICDFGAGTGSSVRALAEYLPPRQDWLLVDYDAANINAAVDALSDWSDVAERQGDDLLLQRAGRQLKVSFAVRDLAVAGDLLPEPADLVTASALADLTSAAWLDRLVAELRRHRVAVLAGLNYDGVMSFDPADPLDPAIRDAFNRHQTGDKGFGPALGPAAGNYLARRLAGNGFTVTTGDSPWRLDEATRDLMLATLGGIAGAAGETGLVDAAELNRWQKLRQAGPKAVTIGHLDVFACHP
ncbi:MAG: class I SAM-dependent methyltransferase [Rhodospirillales bacterium]